MGEVTKKKTHYLFASTLFALPDDYLVSTVLGSCVAVCLFDTKEKIGGINHYLMPLWNGKGLATPKYGNIAIEKLVKRMIAIGCKKENLIAKIFGGSSNHISTFRVGEQNIVVARDMLAKLEIKIRNEHVGGNRGRKIIYDTGTGKVLMKLIKPTNG